MAASRRNILGAFYFRLSQNGNIAGEYTHNNDRLILGENADRVHSDDRMGFEGTYNSIWLEKQNELLPSTEQMRATLAITRPDRKFNLEWRDEDGLVVYTGEGMLVDDLLVGFYQRV